MTAVFFAVKIDVDYDLPAQGSSRASVLGAGRVSRVGGSLEPVIACRLAIARNMNGHRDGLVLEILG